MAEVCGLKNWRKDLPKGSKYDVHVRNVVGMREGESVDDHPHEWEEINNQRCFSAMK